jgi:archaellum component FlaC
MAVRKETEKEYAKLLFIKHNIDQKEIAIKVKVTEKTIGKWITDGKWREQKRSLIHTRTNIIQKFEDQLERWNTAIENREDQLASSKEVDLLNKLASGIKKLETEIGVGEIITTSMELVNFIRTIDFEFSQKLTDYADLYINSKIK